MITKQQLGLQLQQILIMAMLFWLVSTARAAYVAGLPQADAVPGGVAVIALPASATAPVAHFGNERVMVKHAGTGYYAIIGLPLSTSIGEHALQARTTDGKQHHLSFRVTDKTYAAQHIHLDNERLVTPTAEDLVRIKKEQVISQRSFRIWSERNDIEMPFTMPVTGRLSSPFGLRRFFNGKPKQPHSGLDIAAPAGTEVLAPTAGVVVALGNFFYNGNTLFIDHGQGLVTMYCHLSRIDVKQGQQIGRGQRLGAVGMTGRATGPHLHFTVSLNDARVEPRLFFSPDSLNAVVGDAAATPTHTPANSPARH
jgi:murein DD-endopeptidase MepM/ murein hydrolase activator NlpD